MTGLIFASLLLIMLLFAFVGDLLQFAVRIIVSVLNQPNLSTHMVTLSMLINRFGAALGLLLIGVLIDTGTTIAKLSLIYTVLTISLSFIYLATAQYLQFITKFIVIFIVKYYKINIQVPQYDIKYNSDLKNNADISIIYCVALIAFLLPSILAAAIPEYRATLLQTGFILNTFATLYFALKIEKKIALILNNGTEQEKWEVCKTFMLARALGSVFAATIMFTTLLVSEIL